MDIRIGEITVSAILNFEKDGKKEEYDYTFILYNSQYKLMNNQDDIFIIIN